MFNKNILIHIEGSSGTKDSNEQMNVIKQMMTIVNIDVDSADEFYVEHLRLDEGQVFPLSITIGSTKKETRFKITINSFSCHPSDWIRYVECGTAKKERIFAIKIAELMFKYGLVNVDDWKEDKKSLKNVIRSDKMMQISSYKIEAIELVPDKKFIQGDHWWAIYNAEEVGNFILLNNLPSHPVVDIRSIGDLFFEELKQFQPLSKEDKKEDEKWFDRNENENESGHCSVESNIFKKEIYNQVLQKLELYSDKEKSDDCKMIYSCGRGSCKLGTTYSILDVSVSSTMISERIFVYISQYVNNATCAGNIYEYEILYATSLQKLWELVPNEAKTVFHCLFDKHAKSNYDNQLSKKLLSHYVRRSNHLLSLNDAFQKYFETNYLPLLKLTVADSLKFLPKELQNIIVQK
jgi:hypothetical protein